MASTVPIGEQSRVEEITGTKWVPLTYQLRYRVWSSEAQLIDSVHRVGIICDEHDAHSRHWAGFSPDNILVASARLCVHEQKEGVPEQYCYADLDLPRPVASINRLVVEKTARNRGIAQKLDLHRIAAAKEAGAACVVVAPTSDARIQALAKLGFKITSSRCRCSYKEGFWLSVMVLCL